MKGPGVEGPEGLGCVPGADQAHQPCLAASPPLPLESRAGFTGAPPQVLPSLSPPSCNFPKDPSRIPNQLFTYQDDEYDKMYGDQYRRGDSRAANAKVDGGGCMVDGDYRTSPQNTSQSTIHNQPSTLYNGIAFKGFISGIPGSVLSGGQYDALMRKMGRKDRAIGFAVFLDMLERLTEEEDSRA